MGSILALALVTALLLPCHGQERTPTPSAPPETPTQLFTRYLTALQSARTFRDLRPFWSARHFRVTEHMPQSFFDDYKARYARMSDIRVAKETVTNTGLTLTIEGITDGQKKTWTLGLWRENGEWKVDEPEDWQ